jgi:hypothetical protein
MTLPSSITQPRLATNALPSATDELPAGEVRQIAEARMGRSWHWTSSSAHPNERVAV